MDAAQGGVGTTTSFLDFPDEETAASTITVGADRVTLGVGPRPNSPSAIYRIIARCVAR